MLLSLVFSLIAAVSLIASPAPSASPLPFTPPNGWTMMPAAYTNFGASSAFVGPKTRYGQEAVATVTMAIPMSVDSIVKSMKSGNNVGVISGQALTVCGRKAYLLTSRVSGGPIISESLFTESSGSTHILTYTRPRQVKANLTVEGLLRHYCGGALAPASLPVNWTRRPEDFKMAGMWLGPQVLQMMTLMRVHGLQSPQSVINQMSVTSSRPQESASIHVKSVTHTTLCGNAATFATIQGGTKELPLVVHMVTTASNSTAYVLTYMHPSSETADPGALASLKTLCASAPSPGPTPSPAATPLSSAPPTPTSTIVPQPSPTVSPGRTTFIHGG
ncbi:MAG: hypothetical protein JO165_06485 [Candidatus Eremiobacteraeota bacterium]|nr:hypothetical protein [Candidatus Eremiobacteraeota bacterium]